MAKFIDRRDAGRKLAQELERLTLSRPLILGLPRGGIPVAAEVARRLSAPLDAWMVRKVRVPWCPEMGIGAVSEGGQVFLCSRVACHANISPFELDQWVAARRGEVDALVRLYRDGASRPDLRQRSVVVVDDGVVTGSTARAAIAAVRRRDPRELVLAVPAAARDTLELIAPSVDRIVCLTASRELYPLGFWYRDFEPVTDREARQALQRAGASCAPPPA